MPWPVGRCHVRCSEHRLFHFLGAWAYQLRTIHFLLLYEGDLVPDYLTPSGSLGSHLTIPLILQQFNQSTFIIYLICHKQMIGSTQSYLYCLSVPLYLFCILNVILYLPLEIIKIIYSLHNKY